MHRENSQIVRYTFLEGACLFCRTGLPVAPRSLLLSSSELELAAIWTGFDDDEARILDWKLVEEGGAFSGDSFDVFSTSSPSTEMYLRI